MKSKISLAFDNCRKAKRPALITYTVAGDNTKNNSLKILNKISKHADILELGFRIWECYMRLGHLTNLVLTLNFIHNPQYLWGG